MQQSPVMTSLRRVVGLLAVLAIATACSPTPSPSIVASPAVDENAVYDEIETEVTALRGLEPTADVDREVLDEDQMIERVTAIFEADNPPEYVAASERTLKALGLLEANVSLRDLYLDALRSQVLGFYDRSEDDLFVVSRSGNLGALERSTFAHEYTHALQDQAFDYWGDADTWRDNGDLALARTSLSEGDATALMTRWATEHMSPDEAAEMLSAGLDPEMIAELAAMPAIIREELSFPYQQGLVFVTALQGMTGFDQVDEAYSDPPTSSEQILHPDKYAAGEDPIDVEAPTELAGDLGEGWSVALEDTLGEFRLRIWLREATGRAAASTEAAAGWGGDRMVLLEGPDDAWALVLQTEWDDASEAEQFDEAAAAAVEAGPYPGATAHQPGTTSVTVMIASDTETLTLVDAAVGTTGV
jgi:hypothetical protein